MSIRQRTYYTASDGTVFLPDAHAEDIRKYPNNQDAWLACEAYEKELKRQQA